MTVIEQLPEQIDSNVTIHPPAKIEIKYTINYGWYIVIDGQTVKEPDMSIMPLYFDDAAEPMQYLIDRHLVKTKAYRELEKAVKKVHNRSKKSKS